MSILQGLDPQAIAEHFGEVDTEYTWTAEPLPVPVCLQVKTCNGAAILALEVDLATAIGQNEQMLKAVGVENFPAFLARIAELERERDAAQQSRARLVELVRAKNIETDVMASDIRNIEAQLSAVVIANAKENAQLRAELEQVKAERDAMGAVVASQSRNACVSGGTPTLAERALERARDQLRAELDAANKRAGELQKNLSSTEAFYVAAKERAEDTERERDAAIADARRLAHIAKHVHIVSESENNLIEKYTK